MSERTFIKNIAIGDEKDTTILHIPDSSGNASLDKNCIKHKHTIKEQPIEVDDIYEYIKDCKSFAMKIDIEGTEYKILNRIAEIDNFDSYCIMFEFNRFSSIENKIIERFLIGKKVACISRNKIEMVNKNFFTYNKGNWSKLNGAHDIIVCKNINWE